ncbi:MAG: alpha/beta hydrolase [Chloroflexota bacterium]|nr:MAG: alpha/beta hydrolase [Chloroflexota bacterium]
METPKSTGLITLNGLTINHTITGHGRPVVLVHGHASSQDLWAKVNLLNSGNYCRYTLDLPGHGAADKPPLEWFSLENYTALLEDFCRYFGLKDIVLVGHSMGGLLSLNLALTRPEWVASMILIAPVVEGSFLAYLDPWLNLEKLVHQPLAERLLQFYNAYPWLAAPVGLNWYARPSMLLTDSFKQAQADFARCPLATLYGNFKLVRQADLRPHLSRLQTPTLVITGDQDRVVPPRQAELLARYAPHAKLVIIPQSGHLPFDEQPELFAAAVVEYVKPLP